MTHWHPGGMAVIMASVCTLAHPVSCAHLAAGVPEEERGTMWCGLLCAMLLGAPTGAGSVVDGAPGVARAQLAWRLAPQSVVATAPAHVRPDQDLWLAVVVHFSDGTCAAPLGAYLGPDGATHQCSVLPNELSGWRAHVVRVLPQQTRVHRDARGQGPHVAWKVQRFAQVSLDTPVLATEMAGDVYLGALRFGVQVEDAQGRRSPLAEQEAAANGGLVVAVRRDDSPAGVAWELRGVPVADVPRGLPWDSHPTATYTEVDDTLLPAFVARRMGLDVPFLPPWMWPKGQLVPVAGTPLPGDLLWDDARGVRVVDRVKPSGALDTVGIQGGALVATTETPTTPPWRIRGLPAALPRSRPPPARAAPGR